MKEINRTIHPPVKLINSINISNPNEDKLDNGIPVYKIDKATQELVKIEFLFAAGSREENKILTAGFTNRMLKEGTENYTSSEIASTIDFYGAHLETSSDKDNASVTLYTLNKYIDKTLPIVAEVIRKPVFPEKELATMKRNRKQNFLVNSEKVRYVAKRKFNEIIFGDGHPYGKMFVPSNFDEIIRNDVEEFYKSQYTANNCKIIVAGKVPRDLTQKLNVYFGDFDGSKPENEIFPEIFSDPAKKFTFIEKPGALQTAIRIGKALFNKTHPDFQKLRVLNTVLGGYFGSRLMTNIREDKGYTYGIGSAVVSLRHTGYFFITSEVGTSVTSEAIKEVYKEINILQNDLISKDELQLVKNYMTGSVLRSMDGAFQLSNYFKGLVEFGMDFSYVNKYMETIKETTADDLRDLAQKYLAKDSLFELTVGGKK
jgi:predicted Zn-dependent peptidase